MESAPRFHEASGTPDSLQIVRDGFETPGSYGRGPRDGSVSRTLRVDAPKAAQRGRDSSKKRKRWWHATSAFVREFLDDDPFELATLTPVTPPAAPPLSSRRSGEGGSLTRWP